MKLSKIKTSPFWFKVLAIHGVNLVLLFLILLLLGKLPQKAQVMQDLRNQKIAAQESMDVDVLEAELLALQDQIKVLEDAFVTDSQLLHFIEKMDELKAQGLIADYEPLSSGIVRSKKSSGLPVEVNLQGDPATISKGLNSLAQTGFLFKPVTFVMSRNEDGSYQVRYGIFLYSYE